MKRAAILSVVAFLLFAAMRTESPLPPLSVEIEIAPSSLDPIQLLDRKTPYTYTCRALIVSANDERELLAEPIELVATPGKRETVTKKGPFADVTFTVALSAKKDRAATEVVLSRGGEIVHRQKSHIVLDAKAMAPRPKRK